MDFENPRPYDILCGRNRNSFNNIGNRRFRITISMNVEKYNSMRSRHERSKFIASLAQTMRYEVGFRFLKKKGGKNPQTVDLSDEEIRAKIGHALRDLSSNLRQEGGDHATPESKVPRPGPYKRQDTKALRIVSSSSSLETMSSSSVQSTLDGTEEDKKPPARMATPPFPKPDTAPSSSSSFAQFKVAAPMTMATIQEQEHQTSKKAPTAVVGPDEVRSCSPPPLQLVSNKLPQEAEEEATTPLISNLAKSIKTVEPADEQQLYSLDIGEACKSLLNPPPLNLIPSLDDEDDMDDFWRLSGGELQNDSSALASAISITRSTANMSLGSWCDNMSLPSSCCLSDAMETLSLVSSN